MYNINGTPVCFHFLSPHKLKFPHDNICSLWQKQNRWYDLYCKERQTKAQRFFKTCPRALELVSGTRAGTRNLMSDFILVCPFQNSSSAFCHMCKLYHLFYERPTHSFPISNVPFIKAYFIVSGGSCKAQLSLHGRAFAGWFHLQ